MTIHRFIEVTGVVWRRGEVNGLSPFFQTFIWDGTFFFVLYVFYLSPSIRRADSYSNWLVSSVGYCVDLRDVQI